MTRMVAAASRMATATAAGSAADQSQVGGPDGCVGSGPHGQTQIGLGERGGVVDPVATNATGPALARRSRSTATFSSGRTPAKVSPAAMPSWSAICRAARSLSPVSSTGRRPSLAQPSHGAGRARLELVGHDQRRPRLAVPAGQHRGAARAFGLVHGPAQLRGDREVQLSEQPRAAHSDHGTVEVPRTPAPGSAVKPSTAGRPPSRAAASRASAWPTGCSEESSTAPARRSASAGLVLRGQ